MIRLRILLPVFALAVWHHLRTLANELVMSEPRVDSYLERKSEQRGRTSEVASLLVLRSLVEHPALLTSRQVIVLPDSTPQSEAAAADLLYQVQKPTICRSFAIKGILAVQCLPSSLEPKLDLANVQVGKIFYDEAVRQAHGDTAASIEIVGVDEEVFLSVSGFGRWMSEYNFMFALLESEPISNRARGHHAVLSLRVHSHPFATAPSDSIVLRRSPRR